MSEQRAVTPHQGRHMGDTAVVVGASMAGLCAARVLADRFRSVVVLDRDELPHGAEPRRLVPQGRHPHLLLTAGARLLEGWFPGISEELRAGGAVDVDFCGDFYWYQAGGCQRRPASHMRGPVMSRPLLERTVRRRVETLANVVIRDETAAEGLIADTSGERIIGVRLADGNVVDCDLVVDATGRGARSLAWIGAARLRAAGHVGRRRGHSLRESHLSAHRHAPHVTGRRPPSSAIPTPGASPCCCPWRTIGGS